jgi:transcriptional regulator with XRE-family HTH domain
VKHDLKSIIGARVRAARNSAGLTQARLAEAIDRTVEAVSNIERGRSLPPLDLLQRIGVETGCALASLVDIPADDSATPERAALEMRLLSAGRGLPLEQLRIAVVQIEALHSQG